MCVCVCVCVCVVVRLRAKIVPRFAAEARDLPHIQRVRNNIGSRLAHCVRGTLSLSNHALSSSVKLISSGAVPLLTHAFLLCTE